jgi:hypothetical protein
LGAFDLAARTGRDAWCHVSTADNVVEIAAHTFQALVALPHMPKHVELPPVMKMSQSCVVGGLAVGSTVSTSLQFSRVIGCWMAAAAVDAAFSAAALMGFEGAAGIDDDTAAVALLKNPLTLSRIGTCSSATAIAGRARRRLDVKRIVAMCGEGVLPGRTGCCG